MDFVRESPSAAIDILQSLVPQLRSQIPKDPMSRPFTLLIFEVELLIVPMFIAKAVPPFALFGLPSVTG
jgi:hypothetical protein